MMSLSPTDGFCVPYTDLGIYCFDLCGIAIISLQCRSRLKKISVWKVEEDISMMLALSGGNFG